LVTIGIYSISRGFFSTTLIIQASALNIASEKRLRGVKEGVLSQVFGGPVAKVLDQAMYVGGIEQTVPMLVESTGLSFKTAQKAVVELNRLGLVKRSRKIGNTQTYRFDVRNDLHDLISWAERLKVRRLRR